MCFYFIVTSVVFEGSRYLLFISVGFFKLSFRSQSFKFKDISFGSSPQIDKTEMFCLQALLELELLAFLKKYT